MTGALVATRDAQQRLTGYLEKARARLAAVLPVGWSPERMISMVLSAYSRDPNLARVTTTEGLMSIVQSTMRAAELGLELNTPLGEAYLIGYWDPKTRGTLVQFQPGYRGYVKLAYASERVLLIDAAAVHERDKFSCTRGTHPSIEHAPVISEPGPVVAVYATMRLEPASENVWKMDMMTMPEVFRIRDRSQAYMAFRAGKIKSTPWSSDEVAMSKKTVVSRMLKLAPLSEGVRAAIAYDPDSHEAPLEHVEVRASRTDALKDKLGAPREREPGDDK